MEYVCLMVKRNNMISLWYEYYGISTHELILTSNVFNKDLFVHETAVKLIKVYKTMTIL